MDDEFAQWGAADMVTLYMDNHNGEWPRSWDDLREFYDDGRSRIGGWSFEKYQSRVFIDFAVTAKELQELSFRPGPVGFNVIHARLTYTVYNPNETIRQYFQEKKQAHAEQPSVEATD
ncbi:hypothetical protein [Schlesneria sp.]|uniref:hypothetical protein n=1 Tax=Schlesneria sp. TaxID=2762018 RepID=UPI002F057F5A